MNRLNNLSAAAIRAMFSSETEEQVIMLLTIHDPDPTGSDYPIRLADSFTGRLTGSTLGWAIQELETKEGYTTDAEVIYGVTRTVNSQLQEFVFLPMQINLPPEHETGVGSLSITINYVTPQAIILIRKYLTQPTRVTIDLVLGSNTNNTEASFDNFWITNATYNAQSITFQLDMISFSREPFPSFSFTPSYFPGLF
jgi:hypothetical protein